MIKILIVFAGLLGARGGLVLPTLGLEVVVALAVADGLLGLARDVLSGVLDLVVESHEDLLC